MNDEKIPDAVKTSDALIDAALEAVMAKWPARPHPYLDEEQRAAAEYGARIWRRSVCALVVEVAGRAPAPPAAAEVPSLAPAPLPQEQQDAIQKLCDAEGVISPADCGDSLGNWAKAVLIARRDTIAARDAAQATAERLRKRLAEAQDVIEAVRLPGNLNAYCLAKLAAYDASVSEGPSRGAPAPLAPEGIDADGEVLAVEIERRLLRWRFDLSYQTQKAADLAREIAALAAADRSAP